MPALARHSTVPGSKPFAGQALPTPSQLSATSQTPALGRQLAVLLASAGQAALDPVQCSARSQMPALARHSTVLASKSSAGQSSPTPSQLSAMSHTPALGRQLAVLLASAGQSLATPSQVSSRSQTPAAGRHTSVLFTSSQTPLVPLQTSAGSHSPVLARHGVEAGTNVQSLAQQESGAPFAGPSSHSSVRGKRPPSPHTSCADETAGSASDATNRSTAVKVVRPRRVVSSLMDYPFNLIWL